jgi:cephalosporin hydroxylase
MGVSENRIINEADNLFQLQQHVKEIEPVVKLLSGYKNLDSFIEIGSNKGGTFYILSSLIPGKKISIDYCDGNFGGVGQSASVERNKKLSEKFPDTHFIEGDSHNYSTVAKLKEILGDKKVSVLFIDGDHTFEGCYKDLIIYRQFLRQNGFILFHDIKKTDYHTSVNCRVDLVWNEVKKFLQPSDYWEFVDGDSTDCSTAMQHATNIGWGGIGVVKNSSFYKRRNLHLFQVFYNQISLDSCLKNIANLPLANIPELLIHIQNDHFFENQVIEDVFKNYKFGKDDFIGVTSPIVTQKTGVPVRYLYEQVKEHEDLDIIVYSPTYDQLGLKDMDIWEVNKDKRCNLYQVAEFLNNSNVIPFDLFGKKWYLCYCNYWIAKAGVFKDYVSKVLVPTMDFFKNDERFKKYLSTINFEIIHRGQPYPIEVFILEGLFGSFASNSDYKVHSLTIKDFYKNVIGNNVHIERQQTKPLKKYE